MTTATDEGTTATDKTESELSQERQDLLASLATARHFLRYTARDLTDVQARTTSTVSALSVGGLVKHVNAVERAWARFIAGGGDAMHPDTKDFTEWTEDDFAERENDFRLLPGETLAGVLAAYEETAAATERLLAGEPSLDRLIELPKAPWYTETHYSVRRVLHHVATETAQHAGHADIIRESIDGAKSMG